MHTSVKITLLPDDYVIDYNAYNYPNGDGLYYHKQSENLIVVGNNMVTQMYINGYDFDSKIHTVEDSKRADIDDILKVIAVTSNPDLMADKV